MLLAQSFLLFPSKSPSLWGGVLLLPLPGEGSLETFEHIPLAKLLASFGLGAFTKSPGVGMEPQSRQG